MKTSLQHLAWAVAVVVLAGCGSSGDDGDTAAPPPVVLNVASALKELRFTWPAVADATFYRLFENPDGAAGFSQIGGDLTTLGYNHPIAVHRRVNASYRLDACNAAGCRSSAIIGPGNLTQAIGYVKASNPGVDDEFGVALALSADGNTLAVGAWNEASGTSGINSVPNESAPFAGAVYVFTRTAGGWAQQAYIKASNAGGGDGFGGSVALSADGNTLAVGAWHEASSTSGINSVPNESAPNAGAAYVFIRSGNAWSQQAYIKASNTGAGDEFGLRVALSGDGNTLAVAARNEDSGTTGVNTTADESAANAGAAYVFTRSGVVWSQQAYLKASNTGANDLFGASLGLSSDGNTLAVGADFEDSGAGAVYVFLRSAGTWSEQAYIKAANAAAMDRFGIALGLSGDGNTLAVGAFGEDSGTSGVNSIPNEAAAESGAAYVFTRSGATWSQQAYLKASNTGPGDAFGIGIAISADGSTIAVGADLEDSSTAGVNSTADNAATNAGAVYLFARNGTAWSQQAYVKASNPAAHDLFGFAVALSADGNTLAVGAESEDGSAPGVGGTPDEGASFSGAVYLY